MATTDRKLELPVNLTSDECDFIVQVLRSVQLKGNPASLRQAIEIIDSIVGKLAEESEDTGEAGNSQRLP